MQDATGIAHAAALRRAIATSLQPSCADRPPCVAAHCRGIPGVNVIIRAADFIVCGTDANVCCANDIAHDPHGSDVVQKLLHIFIRRAIAHVSMLTYGAEKIEPEHDVLILGANANVCVTDVIIRTCHRWAECGNIVFFLCRLGLLTDECFDLGIFFDLWVTGCAGFRHGGYR